MMIKHVMLLKIVENNETDDNLDQIREELLAASDDISGLVSAEIGYNVSSSDFDIAFIITMKNPTALKHFYNSDKYVEIKSFIDKIADTISTVDYMTDPDNLIKRVESTEKKSTTQKKNSSVKSSKPATKQSKSSSKKKTATKAPVVEAVAEAPVVEAVAKAPVVEAVAEAPVVEAVAKAPVVEAVAKAPVVEAVAETPVVEEVVEEAPVVSQPIIEEPVMMAPPIKKAPAKEVTNDNVDVPVAKTVRPVQRVIELEPDNSMNVAPVSSRPVQNIASPSNRTVSSAPTQNTVSKPSAPKHVTYTPIEADFDYSEPIIKTAPAKAEPVNAKPATKAVKKVIVDDEVVLKRIEPKGKQIKDGEFAMEDAWKCPVCGKINGVFVGICGCGSSKPDFYEPLTNKDVSEARLSETPEVETDNLQILGNNMLAPSMDDLVNTFKPVVTRTVNAIKRSASDNYDEPVAKDNHVSVAERAAANLSLEETVDTIRIEPKGKQIKDGESSMVDAWKCPLCGKINGAFVGICGCGAHIPENYTPVSQKELDEQTKSKKEAAEKNLVKKTSSKKSSSKKQSAASSSLKNITDSLTKTLTDAMNNASSDVSLPTAKSSKSSKKSNSAKKVSYNEKLLSSNFEDEKTIKIEPKGSQPVNGESAMVKSWSCPKCGKVNAKYIGKCGCGYLKDSEQEAAREFA